MTTKIIGGWNCLSKNQLKPMKYIQRTPSGKYRIKKNHGNNKIIHYGVYDTLEEAKLARDELIRKNWPLPIKKINPRRYIEETVPGSFLIRKFDEGKMVDYGTYYALEYAQYIRDNLEKCNWDKTQLPLIIKQYPKYYTDSLIFFKNIRYEKGSNYPWKILFMKWHDGKNFIKMYSGFSKLEDALWEGPKTSKELSKFIMFNGFKLGKSNVSTQTINHIVRIDKKNNGILRDVEVTETVPKKYYIKE